MAGSLGADAILVTLVLINNDLPAKPRHRTYDIEQVNRERSKSEVDPFTEGRYRQFARHLGSGFTGEALDVECDTGRGGTSVPGGDIRCEAGPVELLADHIEHMPLACTGRYPGGLLGDALGEAGLYDAPLTGELDIAT